MQNLSIRYTQHRPEKFLLCKMEVMHETRIVDDASIINVCKTNLDGGSKKHFIPFMSRTCEILTITNLGPNDIRIDQRGAFEETA